MLTANICTRIYLKVYFHCSLLDFEPDFNLVPALVPVLALLNVALYG